MSIGKFNENRESIDSKESSVDNTEKPRNQILETPKGYKDDFDKKADIADQKIAARSREGTGDVQNNAKPDEKQSRLERLKSFFRKEDGESKEASEANHDGALKNSSEKFRDSLKGTMTPEEVSKYNREHGYPDVVKERPKGGWERERIYPGQDIRSRGDTNEDDQANKNGKL